jgi:hypothetical protein
MVSKENAAESCSAAFDASMPFALACAEGSGDQVCKPASLLRASAYDSLG